jgi:lipopolysaccharide export LptBFGC system permease protein LptF
MSLNTKRAIVYLIGGLGLIFLLIGAVGHVYATSTGVIIMFGCWLVSGVLASLWGIRKRKS